MCSLSPPRSFGRSLPNLVGVCRWTSHLPLRGSFRKGQRVTFAFHYIIYAPASRHTAAKGAFCFAGSAAESNSAPFAQTTPGSRHPAAKSTRRMMTPGSRHTAAKSTHCLLLARRVNLLVMLKVLSITVNQQILVCYYIWRIACFHCQIYVDRTLHRRAAGRRQI